MSRARVLQEIRIMKFEEVYERWTESRLTQAQAAEILGVRERQFRRQCRRYDEDGIEGLIDKRIGEVSGRRAPVDEVMKLAQRYRSRYSGWTVKHFHAKYREEKGKRSYNFVRLALQRQGLVEKAKHRGVPGPPPYMSIVSATPTEPPAAGMGHFFALARAPLRLFASMRR